MTLIALDYVLLAFVLAVLTWHLVGLRSLGKALAAGTLTAEQERSHLDGKRSKWMCAGSLLVIAVCLVEARVALAVNAHPYPTLFYVHLPLAVLFVGLFVLLGVMTGKLNPKMHRILGYVALFDFLLVGLTGAVLLAGLS